MKLVKNKAENKVARFYDLFYEDDIGESKTKLEISLIISLIDGKKIENKESIKILDVGAGSGRLSLELKKEGFDVFSLDPLPDMLNTLRSRFGKHNLIPKIVCSSFENFRTKKKFDVVLFFWNTFAQIVRKKSHARKLFKKVSKILSNGGILVVQQDEVEKSVLYGKEAYLDEKNLNGREVSIKYQFINYNPRMKTSMELEVVLEKNDGKRKKYKSTIRHTWFAKKDFLKFAKPNFRFVSILDSKNSRFVERGFYLVCKK